MSCAFCGTDTAKISMKSALAEGGLVKLPVCPVDETYLGDTFSNPLSSTQLIRMQKLINA